MDARRRASALEQYARAGYDTVPLRANTRDAFLQNWTQREPREMWEHAPSDANIGLRAGGQLHFAPIDADDKNAPQTTERVARFLDGLGLHRGDYPLVRTPSNGAHLYISLIEGIEQGAYCKLARDIGAGEFRYGRGAQVAAPPSKIDGKTYKLESGDFEKLPRVTLADLRPILAQEISTAPNSRAANSSYPTISRKARAMLRGEGIDGYQTRSEAEQAIISSLVNSGHDFDSILSLFMAHPCAGKFAEIYAKNPRNATRWLRHSFEKAQQWTHAHESQGQQITRGAIEWAMSREWCGKTGAVDRAVFLAHTTIAYRSGRAIYAASCRDLAELAGVGFMTAARATNRLIAMRLVQLELVSTFNLASCYSLNSKHLEKQLHADTLSNYFNVRECISTQLTELDIFRAQGLGKTGAQVWELLNASETALQVKDIAARTGRHRSTVYRMLEKMRALGIVTPSEIVGREITFAAMRDIDLNAIARMLGVNGIGAKQRVEHERQRAARRELGKRYAHGAASAQKRAESHSSTVIQ